MLKIILIIVGIIVLAIAVILVLAAMKSDTFRISRSTLINASQDKIAPNIQNFRKWAAWNPYEKMEKEGDMKKIYTGPESGVGAKFRWEGKKTGIGEMEILESSNSRILIKLDFIKPFEAHNMAIFTLEPQGAQTKVTWTMEGPLPYMAKVMHTVMNADKMLGNDFDKGLADLKRVSEQ
jgi:hypothetical protein